MPQVTPLAPHDQQRRGPDVPTWLLAAITGVAGLALGLLAGITTSAGEPAEDPPLTGPRDLTDEVGATTTLGASLRARIPDFNGVLSWVDTSVPPQAQRWAATAVSGEVFDLPARTRWARWNANATRVAALVSGEREDSLEALGGDELVAVAVGVVDFAWHSTDPDRIAWFDAAGRVWMADAPGYEPEALFGDSRLRNLIAWGDWGYAVQLFGNFDDSEPALVQTRNPDNEVLGTTDLSVVAVADDGESFMLRRDDSTLILTRRDLTTVDVQDWAVLSNVAWSPVGEEIAGLVPRAGSITLELRRDTGVFEYRLGALDGYIGGWSADGRFIAIVSTSVTRQGERGPGVIVVDLLDRSTHVFAVDATTAAIS